MNIFVLSFFTTFDYYNKSAFDELKSLLGDKTPSYSTMKNFFNKISRSRSSLKDEIRNGPAKTTVVPENTDAVRELIIQDRHDTHREIAVSFSISSTSIDSILHEQLALKDSRRSSKNSCCVREH